MKKLLQNRYLSYWVVLFVDLMVAAVSMVVSIFAVRYFGGGGAIGGDDAVWMFVVGMPITVLCFYLFHTYRHIIRHSSLKGLWNIGAAVLLKGAIFYVLLHILPAFTLAEKSIVLGVGLDLLFCLVGMIGVRVAMVLVYDWIVEHSDDKRKRVLIYGVGDKSVAIKTRLHKSPHYRVVGFLNAGTSSALYRGWFVLCLAPSSMEYTITL